MLKIKKIKVLIGFLIAVLALVSLAYLPKTVIAAQIAPLSDNLSRIQASTLADHTILFDTPTGVAAAGTVTVTFGAGFSVGSFALLNEDFATSSSSTCSSATYVEQTLATSPAGATWGVGSSGNVFTFTSGSGTVTADTCVRIRIGANAVTGGTGASIITNGTAGSSAATVTVATSSDSGVAFVPIISNDQVVISATVNPTLTFSISQNSIDFGTLTSANGRWATNGGGAATPTTSLTATAGTNAASGYTIYVLGGTLTSGSNTIAALGSSTASSPGSSQFGLNGAIGSSGAGAPAVSSPYSTASQYAFTATTTTQTPVFTNNAPDSGTTFDISYLANISALVPAGSYTATHTWTATANF